MLGMFNAFKTLDSLRNICVQHFQIQIHRIRGSWFVIRDSRFRTVDRTGCVSAFLPQLAINPETIIGIYGCSFGCCCLVLLLLMLFMVLLFG